MRKFINTATLGVAKEDLFNNHLIQLKQDMVA